jgi:hypothetical protein
MIYSCEFINENQKQIETRETSKGAKIPSFSKDIEKNSSGALELSKFIYNNKSNIIYLDVNLTTNNPSFDGGRIFSFTLTDLVEGEENMGGEAVQIDLDNREDFYFDERPYSQHMNGYFKVIGITGPQQGWMTSILKPVKIEDAQ